LEGKEEFEQPTIQIVSVISKIVIIVERINKDLLKYDEINLNWIFQIFGLKFLLNFLGLQFFRNGSFIIINKINF
jgi:hypothetical protein